MRKFIPKIEKVPFTLEGFDELLKKRETILSHRPSAVKELQRARELGDLSENGFYKAARARLSGIDAQLRRLDSLIKRADVRKKEISDITQIGSVVTVGDGKNTFKYQIVGEYEADPKEKKISHISPIGKALIGKKVSDTVEIIVPNGKKISLKVVSLS